MVYKNKYSKIRDFKYSGIKFKVQTTVHRDGNAGYVKVEVFTEEWERIDLIQLHDVSGIETAMEILKQSIHNYLENNLDEIDELFAKLTYGGEF